MIREVRKFKRDVVIVLTLHEYLGMCNAQGQMLKTNGLLCDKAAPLDCHECFPGIAPQDFFLRELFVKSFFKLCDHFICPSAFLRQRYLDWGLPADKLSVVENGQPPAALLAAPGAPLNTRFVVLGQLSRLKGTLVLLEAARLLARRLRRRMSLEIHGSMQHESDEFKAQFKQGLAGIEDLVRYCGPYRHADVGDIIQRSGWVITPSIWWENSPLVIQEAFAARRPVICSNIGGMAEKVEHGVSGLHFRVGSASDLAVRLEQAATQPGLWEGLCNGLPRPPTIRDTVDILLGVYRDSRALDEAAHAPVFS
jgi:glycosyltransferase involved in cell wall biosynthesis